jgi:parvulin-like peptidyl-prolyl isomerase
MKLKKKLARIKIMNYRIIFILSILFYSLIPNLSLAEVTNKILAVVNDEVITQQELEEVLVPIYVQYQTMYRGQELEEKFAQAQKDMFNQLIEDRLLLQQAKKENIQVNDKEVEAKIEELKQRFPNPEQFMVALEQQGISLNKLEDLYREQLMIRELVNRQVRSRVVVDPQQVTDYYQKHLEEFREPEAIKISNILIRTKDVTEATAKDEAEEVLKALKEGGDFAQLAQEHSQGPNAKEGGEMGFVSKGQLLKDIDEVIFKLNPGEISGLIKTNLGYHIFKVEEKRPSSIKPLNEVRTQISDILYKQMFDQKFNEWIERLKKHAYIAIK